MDKAVAYSRLNWRPAAEEELLLRAALSDHDVAMRSWKEWRERVEFESILSNSTRILPLVYANLKGEIEASVKEKIKGVYKLLWLKNEMILSEAREVQKKFHKAEIDILFIKGIALLSTVYDDRGLRPLSDMDILVSPRDLRKGIELLEKAQWTKTVEIGDWYVNGYQSLRFFKKGVPFEIDLHWYVTEYAMYAHADDDMWQNSIGAKHLGEQARILNKNDLLVVACANGTKYEEQAPLRCIADAFKIINSEPSVDSGRFIEQIQKHRLVLQAIDFLEYLKETFGVLSPNHSLAILRQTQNSVREKWSYEIGSKKRGSREHPSNASGGFKAIKNLGIMYQVFLVRHFDKKSIENIGFLVSAKYFFLLLSRHFKTDNIFRMFLIFMAKSALWPLKALKMFLFSTQK